MEKHLKNMLQEVKKNQAKIYDVREDNEWEEGHLKEAWHLPLSKLRENKLIDQVDKDKKIYLYCRSGNRVIEAESILMDNGLNNITPLEEGFDYLKDEGFEVVDED